MLSRMKILRKLVLPLLKRFSRDIQIRHHFTGNRFVLHSYLHKAYWFHGKNRERLTMELFRQTIRPGDTVIDVGGHIGYLSMYFSDLVGEEGQVHVFEPGPDNLPYIKQNTQSRPNITLVPKAASNVNGMATFYSENIAGQNNSLIEDNPLLRENMKNAFVSDMKVTKSQVEVVRLDDYIQQAGITPNFVKIDVEGFELSVLEGLLGKLESRPAILIELTQNHDRVWDLLESSGYRVFDDCTRELNREQFLSGRGNLFCFHPQTQAELLNSLSIQPCAA